MTIKSSNYDARILRRSTGLLKIKVTKLTVEAGSIGEDIGLIIAVNKKGGIIRRLVNTAARKGRAQT